MGLRETHVSSGSALPMWAKAKRAISVKSSVAFRGWFLSPHEAIELASALYAAHPLVGSCRRGKGIDCGPVHQVETGLQHVGSPSPQVGHLHPDRGAVED